MTRALQSGVLRKERDCRHLDLPALAGAYEALYECIPAAAVPGRLANVKHWADTVDRQMKILILSSNFAGIELGRRAALFGHKVVRLGRPCGTPDPEVPWIYAGQADLGRLQNEIRANSSEVVLALDELDLATTEAVVRAVGPECRLYAQTMSANVYPPSDGIPLREEDFEASESTSDSSSAGPRATTPKRKGPVRPSSYPRIRVADSTRCDCGCQA